MNKDNILVIKSYEGSCLTSLLSFLLMPVLILSWIGVLNLIIESIPVNRSGLFPGRLSSEWSILFFGLLGFGLHEFCQYLTHRLLGGHPIYNNRENKEGRSVYERKYLFPVTLRFWSPKRKFPVFQYVLIALSPAIFNFLLSLILFVWQSHSVISIIWLIGFANSAFIAMDIVAVGIIILSSKEGYNVEDKTDGTFLVKNKSAMESSDENSS